MFRNILYNGRISKPKIENSPEFLKSILILLKWRRNELSIPLGRNEKPGKSWTCSLRMSSLDIPEFETRSRSGSVYSLERMVSPCCRKCLEPSPWLAKIGTIQMEIETQRHHLFFSRIFMAPRGDKQIRAGSSSLVKVLGPGKRKAKESYPSGLSTECVRVLCRKKPLL